MKNKVVMSLIVILLVLSLTGCKDKESVYEDYNDRINNNIELIKVPSSKEDIEVGTILTSDMIDIKEIDKSKLTENTITNIVDLLGKTTTKNIKKNDIFSINDIE